ncbi:4-hydroxy-tetrahydrodipicolinate synthase [Gracilibacillus salitolerans]|uniref:4-hydroxy-tetrahydrodipicolinate synthase n=1 Tax=Gracilibacillus salitolerans TaxID=2663022 RepID=A0A5Q2TFV9_9BACI|nr:4-hydroxy-tetrahydrodipicolinate synthase [Gracilibacillus salitolerans]QGH33505.1 4-hydroxy-tetrahydrodipicolinate synthase [Gracilibacillus salitolerans]
MFKPEGIIPALVTPFDEKGAVDEGALRTLIDNVIDGGCHGIFSLGSNGEFFSLSATEKLQIAKVAVDQAQGRVPVYVGTGCNSTRETIELTNQMEEIGVSAVSVITPYFVKHSQDELITHYKNIANETNLPIILYNIPGLTQNALTPETVAVLSNVDRIVAIKDSSGSFDNVLQYMDAVDNKFSVLVGTDSLILSTLMAGGSGAIAATANLLPKTVVSIYEKWKEKDYTGAAQEQLKLGPIRFVFKKGTLPSVLKEALNQSGVPVGAPRLPVTSVSAQVEAEIIDIISFYEKNGDIK